jgi:hypothetical protein
MFDEHSNKSKAVLKIYSKLVKGNSKEKKCLRRKNKIKKANFIAFYVDVNIKIK